MVKISFVTAVFYLVFISNAFAEGSIKGGAALKGVASEGVTIAAFSDQKDIDFARPDKVLGQTKVDGSYDFRLSAGKYYLVAIKKKTGTGFTPSTGDLYCFFSGNPVDIVDGSVSSVGFNLIKIPAPGKDKQVKGQGGVFGKVSFGGKNLSKVYVYAYKDFRGGFRGPAFQVYPSVDGNFSISLPDGKYFIIARKRAKGGMYGPIEEGDYFNTFFGNPIVVKKGYMKFVEIETVKRLNQLETDTTFLRISGTVADGNGKGLANLFILAYQGKNYQGKPLYVSPRTDKSGAYSFKLPAGNYTFVARETIGGPSIQGEWFGKQESLTISNEKQTAINIRVEKRK